MPLKLQYAVTILSLLLASCSDSKVEQKTEFVTYTMSQFTIFDLSNKEKKYKEWLNKTFGSSLDQIDDVLEYAKNVRTKERLVSDVNAQLLENIHSKKKDGDNEKIDDFVVNVLTPYLWLLRNEYYVSSRADELIKERYVEYFGLSEGKNGLQSLINSFTEYQNGGFYSNDSIRLINDAIVGRGYYLKFDPNSKYVCVFDVDDTLYRPVADDIYDFTVYLIKRRIPCALPSELGYSSNGAKDVVVIRDNIEKRLEEVIKNSNDDSFLYYKTSRMNSIWRSCGLDMDLSKANAIFKKLDSLDFKDKTVESIFADLVLETAIHEAKHKYDEFLNPEFGYNWDSEISAHFAQIMFSNTPYHSLIDGIRRVEGFANVSVDENNSAVVNGLWSIAIQAAENNLTKDDVRRQVYDLYLQYQTYDAKFMTNIKDFEKIIIPKIWENIKN